MKRLLYLLPLALFQVPAANFAVSPRPAHDIHELPSAMIENPAPAFDLAILVNDKPFALTTLKGHPFIINFFASWCATGRIEHLLLMRLAEENHLPLYGIDYQDKPENGSRLLANFGNPYRQAVKDLDGRVGLDIGVYGVPETSAADSASVVRRRLVGPLTAETVNKDLLSLLKQLGQS